MIPAKLAGLFSELRKRGEVRWTGSEWRTRCPAHDDDGPSLYVRYVPGSTNTLIRCGAGCAPESVVAALGMTMADLFHDDDELVDIDEASAGGTGPRPAGTFEPPPDLASRGAAPARVSSTIEPADVDLQAEVYGRLLGGLRLSDDHRRDLRRRGLADDEIDRRGYRSLQRFQLRQAMGRLKQDHDELALMRIPGFRERNGRVQFVDREGMLVPVRDREGRVIALKLRADDSRDGAKYTWISSSDQGGPSPGSPPHIPLGTPAPADTVRLTEGELKADIAFTLSGLPTIGTSGVDQWKSALPILEAMGAKVVLVAFDMDSRTKPGVAAALAACVKELIRLKYEVRLETWDPADGKGIDDLLAAGKRPAIVTGLEVFSKIEEIGQAATGEPGDDAGDAWFPQDPAEEVADFPVECLPARLQRFATEAARSLQCPVDFLGMAMLAVASAAIGNSRRLRIRRGYEEGARIFAAIVAKAGSVKSPALRLVCGPVYAQQKRLTARYMAERQQYAADLEEYEHRRRLAMRSKDPTPPDLERPTRPASGHVYVENITVESLAQVLNQAPRGVLMIRDELTGWVLSLNQYRSGRGADRQVFLSIWSGEPTKIDRKSALDEPLIITDPFVSVIGCIPPAKLAALDDGEDGEDGFIHRILFAYPRPVTGRRWDWEGIRPETRKLWGDAVEALYGLEMDRDEFGDPVPRVLELAPEACRAWEVWYNGHLAETEAPGFPDQLVGPWSKLVAYAVRLALIVHLLRTACGEPLPDEVDADSLERAFRLVAYFTSHARAVYDHLQRPTRKQGRLQKALAWIRAHDKSELQPIDLARSQVAGIRTKSEAEALMKELADLGYGRLEERKARNNRKVTCFMTRPGQLGPVGSSWAGHPNWTTDANTDRDSA
jgi:hypothetical protein